MFPFTYKREGGGGFHTKPRAPSGPAMPLVRTKIVRIHTVHGETRKAKRKSASAAFGRERNRISPLEGTLHATGLRSPSFFFERPPSALRYVLIRD